MLWLLCLATLALISDNMFADPRQWDPDGVTVRTGTAVNWHNNAVAYAEDGSALVVWSREERSYPSLYAQKISADGTREWELDGRLLSRGSQMGVNYPRVVYTDNSFIVVWMDLDENNYVDGGYLRGRIKAMRYSLDGTPMWNAPPLDGVLIHNGNGVEFQPELRLCTDESGGVFVLWQIVRQSYLQHVTSDGAVDWTSPLELPPGAVWSYYTLVADGAGAAFYCWTESQQLYIQKYSTAGVPLWTEFTQVSRSVYGSTNPQAVADGVGGVVVCWQNTQSGLPDVTRAQRINANGEILWPENGVVAIPRVSSQSPRVAPSYNQGDMDGVLFAWTEYYAGSNQARIQKLSHAGDTLWSSGEICQPSQAGFYQRAKYVASDLQGGALIDFTEQDESSSVSFELISRVDISGEPVWSNCSEHYLTNPGPFNISASPHAGENNRVNIVALNDGRESELMWTHSRLLNTGEQVSMTPLDNIVNGGSLQFELQPLQDGRVAYIWNDSRNYNRGNIYYKILEVDGSSEGFQPEGDNLVAAPGERHLENKASCSDGDGGFFCCFTTMESGSIALRVTRRTSTNEQIGDEEGEAIVSGQLPYYSNFYCVPDGAGGAYVAFLDYAVNFLTLVSILRVNSLCQPIWSDPVVLGLSVDTDCEIFGLAPSTSGSCIVLWYKGYFGEYQIHADQVSGNGETEWSTTVTSPTVYACEAISDGQDGAVVAWYNSTVDALPYRTHVQRIRSDGTLLWPEGGVLVEVDSLMTTDPNLGCDEQGNVFVAYQSNDGASESANHVQKISPAGQLLWGEHGQNVSGNSHVIGSPRIAIVNAENIYVSWMVIPTDAAYKIKITHLDGNGNLAPDPFWQSEIGATLCETGLYQENPILVPDGLSGIAVGWLETTITSSTRSLAAQRIFDPIPTAADNQPVLPTEFSLSQNYPNPFNPSTTIEFSLPTSSNSSLKIFDITGRQVATLLDGPTTAGSHRVTFDASNLPSGVYFYNFRANHHSQTRKMVLLK